MFLKRWKGNFEGLLISTNIFSCTDAVESVDSGMSLSITGAEVTEVVDEMGSQGG